MPSRRVTRPGRDQPMDSIRPSAPIVTVRSGANAPSIQVRSAWRVCELMPEGIGRE